MSKYIEYRFYCWKVISILLKEKEKGKGAIGFDRIINEEIFKNVIKMKS